jgi:hypothetical protein
VDNYGELKMPRFERTTVTDGEIRNLSKYQRDLLIDHIDGELEVSVRDPHLTNVRNALMRIGLLRGTTGGTIRPKSTVLTERGRMAVGMVLGDYADALARAGALDPITLLRQAQARRAQTAPISAEVALESPRLILNRLTK